MILVCVLLLPLPNLVAACLGVSFCSKGKGRLVQSNSESRSSSRIQCLSWCSLDSCCIAVNYDSANSTCEKLKHNEDFGEKITNSHSEIISTSRCPSRTDSVSNCVDSYAPRGSVGFRVYEGYDIYGYDDFIESNSNLVRCRQLCVEHTAFLCRSINFRLDMSRCYLSRVTKDDVGSAFVYGGSHVTYEERNCF